MIGCLFIFQAIEWPFNGCRLCRFRNLYYHATKNAYFVVLGGKSVVVNVPDDRTPALLDLTSIDDHGAFYFDYAEMSRSHFTDITINYYEKLTFAFSRFHLGNIMHTLHDDILGLFHVLKQFAYSGELSTTEGDPPFSSDHHIFLLDGHRETAYGFLFKFFSQHPTLFKPDIESRPAAITCFRDIVVGIPKIANWYQYGFFSPQGPIANKTVQGTHVREVSDFLSYKVSHTHPNSVKKSDVNRLVIFSRKENRLIVNENALLDSLSREFNLRGEFLRMEDHTMAEQISVLQQTKVAIGMHGSMLIMAMFMPPGSILLELYPFAVPSDNYTPYRTLCHLNGMGLVYRAWENAHADANVMHPERASYQGGIVHLSTVEQTNILTTLTVPKHVCCSDPYWLFRIYQDTTANIAEVKTLLHDALNESKNLHPPRFPWGTWLRWLFVIVS